MTNLTECGFPASHQYWGQGGNEAAALGALFQALDQQIIFRVRADPKPDDHISPAAAQGAVILIDANGPDIGKELLEVERGVERLGLPKMKFIPGKSLNGDWKGAKAKPEVLVGF